MEEKNFPHDAAYKAFFSNPDMVRSLLQDFVPEDFMADIDFDTLESCSGSYTTPNLQQRHDDMVWRARWKNDDWCYIYLILEFQSSEDWWMALRVLIYSALLMADLIKNCQLKKGDKLPPIFPIVLYNGDPAWNAPTDIGELLADMPASLRRWQFMHRFFLLDEKRLAASILEAAKGESAFLFRMEQAKDPDAIVKIAASFFTRLDEEKFEALRKDIVEWLALKMDRMDPDWFQELKPHGKGSNVAMLMEVLNQHKLEVLSELRNNRQQYIDEGIVLGRAEGFDEGRAEGFRDLLLDMLEDKFGDVSADWKYVIDGITEPSTLSRLAISLSKVGTAGEFEKLLSEYSYAVFGRP